MLADVRWKRVVVLLVLLGISASLVYYFLNRSHEKEGIPASNPTTAVAASPTPSATPGSASPGSALPQVKTCVVGLLPDQKGGSQYVLYDTATWKATLLLHLPDVTPDNYAALSRNGRYAAYTTWETNLSRRYVKVYDRVTGKTTSYLQQIPVQHEIIQLSWLPDNKTLVFVQSDATSLPYQEIKTLDMETNKEQVLAKGEVWRVRSIEETGHTAESFYLKGKKAYVSVKEKKPAETYQKDKPISEEEEWNYYLTQKDIDDIYQAYGGTGSFPIEKVPNMMHVAFSAPRVSPAGTKIVYSTVLERNSAPGARTPLWMTASIWQYDRTSGQTSRIYSQTDGGSIGRVDWVSDQEISFVSYYDFQGSRDSINVLDLASGGHRVVFPYTDVHYNNVTLLPVGEGKLTFTSSKKDEAYGSSKTILLDARSGSYQEKPIMFEGKTVLLEKFMSVPLNSSDADYHPVEEP
ncbi:hypothetical protein [Gorillibacterium sp. CAU 1737]|uniref:hypothetical protein n=1 Tax=Gorillibacterium sp. CAU 1737 TaxID=3140362 RepID=UPI003260340C